MHDEAKKLRLEGDRPVRRLALIGLVMTLFSAICAVAYHFHTADHGVSGAHNKSGSSDLDESEGSTDDGMPYGEITEADVENLMQFARAKGLDLNSEFEKAYQQDENSLRHVFEFSLVFTEFDQNAHTYGQAIYSSLLRMGETWGPDRYSAVLASQHPEVQQRIRDFLYFPISLTPAEHRSEAERETREAFPSLFPKDYRFGQGNPLFAKHEVSRSNRWDQTERP